MGLYDVGLTGESTGKHLLRVGLSIARLSEDLGSRELEVEVLYRLKPSYDHHQYRHIVPRFHGGFKTHLRR